MKNGSAARKQLTVVIPSFEGHLHRWVPLMQSLLASLPNGDHHNPPFCGFRLTVYRTIVSSSAERVRFGNAFESIARERARSRDYELELRRFRILTIASVLRRADDRTLRAQADGLTAESVNRHWYQGLKKLYGCVLLSPPAGVCFMLDSESSLIRNSVCHAATAYRRQNVVLTSPFPHPVHKNHDSVIALSRKLLGGVRGEAFGEVFMMEGYHWVLDAALVSDFLRIGLQGESLVSIARRGEWASVRYGPFVEEALYHFAYPRRAAYGLRYVDAYAEVERAIGADAWSVLLASARNQSGVAVIELLSKHVSAVTRAQAQRLGAYFMERGVLMGRCSNNAMSKVLAASFDMCLSSIQFVDWPGSPPDRMTDRDP